LKPSITVSSKNNMPKLAEALKKLQRAAVYVGIPADHSLRTGEDVTNAQLLYIHTHGSPLQNIPARPVIEPAIAAEDNASRISAELKQAAQSALEADPRAMHQHLEKAGQLGENAAKRWFTDPRNHWAPNAPATIEEKGSDKPLIDTGELRRSITHVVKDS
jgi:hypothetical protein